MAQTEKVIKFPKRPHRRDRRMDALEDFGRWLVELRVEVTALKKKVAALEAASPVQ